MNIARLIIVVVCILVIAGCKTPKPSEWYDKTWNPYDPNRSKQAKELYKEQYEREHMYNTSRYITIYDNNWRSIGHIKVGN